MQTLLEAIDCSDDIAKTIELATYQRYVQWLQDALQKFYMAKNSKS